MQEAREKGKYKIEVKLPFNSSIFARPKYSIRIRRRRELKIEN